MAGRGAEWGQGPVLLLTSSRDPSKSFNVSDFFFFKSWQNIANVQFAIVTIAV